MLQEAIDLQQAFDAECARVSEAATSGKPRPWPQDTATALLVCRSYAHYIRRYLAAANDAATAEAAKCFGFIESYEKQLGDVFDGNADLRLAFDALRGVLAPAKV